MQSIHLYHFHAWKTKLYLLNIRKHINGIYKCLIWSCIWTHGSNELYATWMLVALAQTTSHIHTMIMRHTVALHWLCSLYFCRCCSLSKDVVPTLWSLTPMKSYYYLQKSQASKTPLFILIQSHSLAPTLFYCIRTTMIQLLLAAVAEPLYPLHDLSLPQ